MSFTIAFRRCETVSVPKKCAIWWLDRYGEVFPEIYWWSVDWQMLFNLDKCKVLHLVNNNKT